MALLKSDQRTELWNLWTSPATSQSHWLWCLANLNSSNIFFHSQKLWGRQQLPPSRLVGKHVFQEVVHVSDTDTCGAWRMLLIARGRQQHLHQESFSVLYLVGRRRRNFRAAAKTPSAPRAGTGPGSLSGRRSSSVWAGASYSTRTPAWWWRPDPGRRHWRTGQTAVGLRVKCN